MAYFLQGYAFSSNEAERFRGLIAVNASEGRALSKAERQKLIHVVVQQQEVGTQRELVRALSAMGCEVTQATVSRDIRELDLQKIRTRLGHAKYVPGVRQWVNEPEEAAHRLMRDFVLSIAMAENLIVLRCELGSAAAVSQQIDTLSHADIIGTIAGDNTILVVVGAPERTPAVKHYLDALRDG